MQPSNAIPPQQTDEQKQEEQKYIDELWKDHHYSTEQFDKQLLFISTGALALSITFFADVVPLDKAVYKWIYITALIGFSICIALCLTTHLISAHLIRKRIEDVQNKRYDVHEDLWIPRLNITMVITLVLAIFTLVLFTTLNIDQMGKKNDTGKTRTDGGGKKERIQEGKEVKTIPPVLRPATKQSGN